ncbi:Hypothetical protein LUCI_0395 [Lucifera butyrica]|uniref:Uncharacterized protein n=1 Tax=Lucifera butyrica TaxID=1351585 RepID=A0A498R7S6_9FIRM|nr:hypothetical protein [Lucifera butyrica]VBB05188.1 Hypothetical protein LUCI_0395 [Lucifera butyrica]
MATLKEIERVFECEGNTTVFPPFPTTLPAGGTVPLCSIIVCSHRAAYLVRAIINWSATFTPLASALALTSGGFAQVEFDLLRDGVVIERVFQTAPQVGFGVGIPFTTASTTFEIAAMQILDTSSLVSDPPLSVFELRATNVILTPPLSTVGTVITPVGTTTAAVGAVSLVVEQIEARRNESTQAE